MLTLKKYLKYYNKLNEEKSEQELAAIKEYNKELIDNYPFLKPRDIWTGEEIEDYDYSFTWLDDMPDGWRIAFGMQLCEEIKQELLRWPYYNDDNEQDGSWLNHYKILQIKEKFGELRWYDGGIPSSKTSINSEEECHVWDIIEKYTDLSRITCINCGKPAKWESKGWISPYCDKCAQKQVNRRNKYLKRSKEKIYKIDDLFVSFDKLHKENIV